MRHSNRTSPEVGDAGPAAALPAGPVARGVQSPSLTGGSGAVSNLSIRRPSLCGSRDRHPVRPTRHGSTPTPGLATGAMWQAFIASRLAASSPCSRIHCFSTRPSPAGASDAVVGQARAHLLLGRAGIDDALLRHACVQRSLRGGVAALQALAEPGLQRRRRRARRRGRARAGRRTTWSSLLGIGAVVGDRRHRNGDRERRERRGGRGRQHRWEPSHVEHLSWRSTVTSMPPAPGEQAMHERRRVCENRTRHAASTAHSPSMQSTVLVVEDEPDIVALLRDFLTDAGFAVLTAGDAAAALAALDEQQVDCVLRRRDAPRQLGLRALPADPRVLRRRRSCS